MADEEEEVLKVARWAIWIHANFHAEANASLVAGQPTLTEAQAQLAAVCTQPVVPPPAPDVWVDAVVDEALLTDHHNESDDFVDFDDGGDAPDVFYEQRALLPAAARPAASSGSLTGKLSRSGGP
jgi:hypothetical protein